MISDPFVDCELSVVAYVRIILLSNCLCFEMRFKLIDDDDTNKGMEELEKLLRRTSRLRDDMVHNRQRLIIIYYQKSYQTLCNIIIVRRLQFDQSRLRSAVKLLSVVRQ